MNNTALWLKYLFVVGSLSIGSAAVALAEPAPAAEPVQIKGKVAQYALTPHGDVDGLILTDGTEVRFHRHIATAVVFAVHPGDAVTIRGLKATTGAGLTAVAVVNDATGTAVETGPPGPAQKIDDESRVKLQLHDREGHLNGVVLEDGTIVRLPPPEAENHAARLAVGQPLYVSGDGRSGVLGKVIAAREIGPARTDVIKIEDWRFERWIHEVFGGGDDAIPHVAEAVPPATPKTP